MRRSLRTALLVLIALAACARDEAQDPRRDRGDRKIDRSFEESRTIGRLEDPGLTEASGLVASATQPHTFWAHNDSGGAPELFCVGRRGRSCGTVSVTGAEVIDWEDIARDSSGHLYIGDVGDNARARDSVTVYRVREPTPPGAGSEAATEGVEPLTFRFPRGDAFDVETLLVRPDTRALYLVTKDSPSLVFRGPADGGRLRIVGALRLPGLLALPTGGDISSDGKHVIITTYDRAFEYRWDGAKKFDSIWSSTPTSIRLPLARQREAIAYGRGDRSIVTTSEGAHAPLIERRLGSG